MLFKAVSVIFSEDWHGSSFIQRVNAFVDPEIKKLPLKIALVISLLSICLTASAEELHRASDSPACSSDHESKTNVALVTRAEQIQEMTVNQSIEIQPSCTKNEKNSKIAEIVNSSLQKGLSCLGKLDGGVPKENFRRMQEILENSSRKLKITCEQSDKYENHNVLNQTLGFASFANDPNFPSIHLNPSVTNPKANATDIERIIFHEVIHLLGYYHGESIDYPYACDACCFGSGDAAKIGCEICTGKFHEVDDPEYQKQLMKLAKARGYTAAYPKAAMDVLLKHPQDRELMTWYIINLGIFDSPLAQALTHELNLPDDIGSDFVISGYEQFFPPAEVLANAFRLFLNGNLAELQSVFIIFNDKLGEIKKLGPKKTVDGDEELLMNRKDFDQHLRALEDVSNALRFAAVDKLKELAKSAKTAEEKERLQKLAFRLTVLF